MKQLKLTEHLPVAEMEQRYRAATDVVARTHWQVIWLVCQGRPTRDIADVTGYSTTWISTLVRRYNADGPDALGDRRHQNPGGRALLSAAQRTDLDPALAGPAPDGGLWTGPKVARWMGAK